MTHIRIYPRPYPPNTGDLPPLGLEGVMVPYVLEEAYETRLDITNQIGDCIVEIVASSGLPDGAIVWVDNPNQQVVIQWPPYQEPGPVSLPDGSFEDGGVGWILDPGWTIGAIGEAGNGAQFQDKSGPGFLSAKLVLPVGIGFSISISGRIKPGTSAVGNVWGKVGLSFFDEDRNLIGMYYGDQISSGSGDVWQDSELTHSAPADGFVQPFVMARRSGENLPLFVDNLSWDYSGNAGLGVILEVCLTLQITDSAHRTADWAGCVEASIDPAYDATFVAALSGVNSYEIGTLAGGWTNPDPEGIPGNFSLNRIAADGSTCITIAGNQTFWRSADGGESWVTVTTPPSGASREWRDVAVGNGYVIVIGRSLLDAAESYYAISVDGGDTFTTHTFAGPLGPDRIIFGNDLFVLLCGSNALTVNGIWVTATGALWEQQSLVSNLADACFNGTNWMGVGNEGASYYADALAETWTYGGSSPGVGVWSFNCVAGGPGFFVAGANANQGIWRTTDLGANWTKVVDTVTAVAADTGLGIVVVATSYITYFTDDGLIWTDHTYSSIDHTTSDIAFSQPD